MSKETPRILHCLREGAGIAAIADQFGALGFEAVHQIVLGDHSASYDKSVLRANDVTIAKGFSDVGGRAGPGKLIAIGQALSGYDLIVTYGWDAINAALAHKVFGQHLQLPPLVHHETGSAGFLAAETTMKRKILRRIAMSSANKLVTDVPAIAEFARRQWSMPADRLVLVKPCIELKRFRPSAKPDSLPGLVKRQTERWVGAYLLPYNSDAVAGLVKLLKDLPGDWHLVLIAGDTPAETVRAAADTHEVSHRVHVLDRSADEAKALALVDIYVDLESALSPAAGTAKAMAAAKTVVASRQSAAAGYVSQANRPCLATSDKMNDILSALLAIIDDDKLRLHAGSENRKMALEDFDRRSSAKALGKIYEAAMTP